MASTSRPTYDPEDVRVNLVAPWNRLLRQLAKEDMRGLTEQLNWLIREEGLRRGLKCERREGDQREVVDQRLDALDDGDTAPTEFLYLDPDSFRGRLARKYREKNL